MPEPTGTVIRDGRFGSGPVAQESKVQFAIKTAVRDPAASVFTFKHQKTMYAGKTISKGDTIYIFASESAAGSGLVAAGTVTSIKPSPKIADVPRQTPRVSITVRSTQRAARRLGRAELKPFADWKDGRPETELNFKFYRQATDKIVGISDRAAAFLRKHF